VTEGLIMSSAMEDYLETILNLYEELKDVRVTDIAESLKVAKASVAQAIQSLKKNGMVTQEKYGLVELTQKGRSMAEKVRYRHVILKKFLIEVLGIKPQIAGKDACLMEHVVSPQTMEKVIEFMEKRSQECEEKIFSLGSNNVEKDDKGKKLWEESLPVKALNELNLGQQGKVIRVAGKGSIRRRILDMGITQGVEIYVKGIAPLGDPVEVLVRGYRLTLRREEAANVYVEVQKCGTK
jgi:DtxR family Mn-dependent transcriptional regulator